MADLWNELVAGFRGRVAQLQIKLVCERPPRSLRSRLPLTRGRLVYSPKAAGGRSHAIRNLSWQHAPPVTASTKLGEQCQRRPMLIFLRALSTWRSAFSNAS